MTDWVMRHDGPRTCHAARGAERADFAARAEWPVRLDGDAERFRTAVARQVRQDLWRALSRVRGFSPVVTVETEERPGGEALLRLGAGGALRAGGPVSAAWEARAAELLSDTGLRARWTMHAHRRACAAAEKVRAGAATEKECAGEAIGTERAGAAVQESGADVALQADRAGAAGREIAT
ncbi:hypothetical protein [Oceanicella sp. SM1341]|uniref:hypothetical protein n=1 Tax=Oceanicella sp. SM1341 TaxID=1548889 RepID=UPI000E4E38D3|nr:hypothetical protein [Oceanicella sp. SM1341]